MGFDPAFTGSGASHRGGSVPDPGATAGETRFLCEDGTFRLPATFMVEQAGGAPTIDFFAIPQTARHLRFYGLVRSQTASGPSINPGNPVVAWSVTLNGVTGAVYSATELLQDPTGTVSGIGAPGLSAIPLGGQEPGGVAGYGGLAATTDGHQWLTFALIIPYYANVGSNKSLRYAGNGAGAADGNMVEINASGHGDAIAAAGITRVTFAVASGNFHSGSLIQMLGIS